MNGILTMYLKCEIIRLLMQYQDEGEGKYFRCALVNLIMSPQPARVNNYTNTSSRTHSKSARVSHESIVMSLYENMEHALYAITCAILVM